MRSSSCKPIRDLLDDLVDIGTLIMLLHLVAIVVPSFVFAQTAGDHARELSRPYRWAPSASSESLNERVPVPAGYHRVETDSGSFANWLRHLPLLPDTARVLLYDGRLKTRQDVHHAIIDIDVGRRDLQQCADAVIRLRAEFLYATARFDQIHFNFTSGDTAHFVEWAEGTRPEITGNRVSWSHTAPPDSSYRSFRSYLDMVFTYAGSHSLSRELAAVPSHTSVRPGDIFIQGGFPGHAVVVLDVATEPESGKTLMLLAQSYMPAQQIHVLKNHTDTALSPWYECVYGEELITPEWVFQLSDMMRFR